MYDDDNAGNSSNPENDQEDLDVAASAETGSSPESDGSDIDLESVFDEVLGDYSEDDEEDDEEGDEEESDASEGGEDEEKSEADPDGKKEEEEELPPFHSHPRFKQVIKERNEAREALAANEKKSQSWDAFEDIVKNSGVEVEDFSNVIQGISISRKDPDAAYKLLEPVMRRVMEDTGRLLPADLQNLVQQGHMTRAAAREYAKERSTLRSQKDVGRREAEQEIEARRSQQSLEDEGNAWWSQARAKDASVEKNSELIYAMALKIEQEVGTPRDAKELRALLDAAHERVSKSTSSTPRQGAKPVRQGQGSTRPKAKTKYKPDGSVDWDTLFDSVLSNG